MSFVFRYVAQLITLIASDTTMLQSFVKGTDLLLVI